MNKISLFINNPCNLYFSFWCLYMLQGTLYESGSLISQGLIFIILYMSIRHAIILIKRRKKEQYFIALDALLLLITTYGLLLFVTDGTQLQSKYVSNPCFYYLKTYLMSILPIYSAYYYTQTGKLTLSLFRRWVFVFVIVAIPVYFLMQRELMEAMLMNVNQYDSVTNNSGYLFVALVPCMLVFYRKPIYLWTGITFSALFVLGSMKRGAILTAVMGITYILYKEYYQASKRQKILLLVLLLFIASIFIYYIESVLMQSDYFYVKLQGTLEGASSGRDNLYLFYWNHYLYDSNIIQQLFGHGAWGTLKIYEVVAHNDWLEIIINQGLFGVAIFFFYWLSFFKTSKCSRFSPVSRLSLLCLFLIYFTMTFFSMSIGDMPVFAGTITGFAVADGFSDNYNNNLIKVS